MGRIWRWMLVLGVMALTGCNDPYSQRRLRLREEQTRTLVGQIEQIEKHRSQRLREMEPTLQRWWRYDCELWQRRSPTIGDYIW